MKNVAIVTDTTACVPLEQVDEYDIEVVPVQLIIDNTTYRDGIDISPTEFYSRLRQSKNTPTTSSSSPDPYLNAYLNASRKARSILCLTEPAKFSAMFDSAKVAAKMAKSVIPDTIIEVIECYTAAAGQELLRKAGPSMKSGV
jgi:DegV family protein with EDD domain